jgi:hypothetical protein
VATRRERVILDVESNATSVFARDAAAAGLLAGALDELDGSGRRASGGLDRTSESTRTVGEESRRSGPDIDKYSGRLRTLADAALTLGPAIIPLGAAAIPALTASLAGLGAAAGGIGTAVLALSGIGDGLKALQAYQLQPTAENLAKVRLEMEKLGPAGAEFAHFLNDLAPQFHDLQETARAGLFPGLEDGIDAMLGRLPQVRDIISQLAQGMGDLAREAGESLAGGKFDAFFHYIETDARPTLEAFGHSIGNVAEGIGNLIVAFAPMSRDFTSGLLGATEAFAKWSRGLDQNKGFQHFLQYIQESGPQAMRFLSALVRALAGLAEAAAPYGQVVLPVLTALANAFAKIANSPIGPPLFAAAAAMVAFNRVADITSKTSTRLSTAWAGMTRTSAALRGGAGIGLLAFQLTGLNDKLALSNTAMDSMAGLMIGGPWGAAIGGGIGLIQDFQASNDDLEASIQRADDALASFDTTGMQTSLHELLTQVDQIESTKLFGGGIGQDAKDALSLGALPLAFANSTGSRLKSLFADMSGSTDDAKAKIAELTSALGHGGAAAHGFGGIMGEVGSVLKDTARSAAGLSAGLAELNGWFDKREALRNYRDSLHAMSQSLRDGFGRKDVENLDAIGRNILQVANTIKSPALQRDFLQGARKSLGELASSSGPKAAQAIQRVIDKLDSEGLTHPPKSKLDVDTRAADAGINDTTVRLHKYGNTVAIAKAQVDTGGAVGAINQVTTMLRNLNGTTATTYIRTVRNDIPLPGRADGGTIPGPRGPYGDKMLYMLAPGEEVISNRYGQADRHREVLKAINANRAADGTTVAAKSGGGTRHATLFTSQALSDLLDGAHSAAQALKVLKKALDDQQKAYDRAKQARDDAKANRDNLSSTIQQSLMGDSIFQASSGSVWAAGAYGAGNPQGAIAALNARTDRANRFIAAVNALKAKGVTGAALQAILSEGLEATEAMANADVGTLGSFTTSFNQSNQALAAAGLAGGNAVYGDDVKTTQRALNQAVKELHEIKQAIKDADKANSKAHDKNAKDVTAGVNGAASNGHKRGRH